MLNQRFPQQHGNSLAVIGMIGLNYSYHSSRLKNVERSIDDRISLSVGSISVMEENAVVKYLDTMLLYFRTILHSSYSVLVKAEMGSTYDRLRYSSRALPSHLSRILLELEYIQTELISKLAGLTVASTIGQQKLNGGSKLFADADVRSWVTDSTSYQVSFYSLQSNFSFRSFSSTSSASVSSMSMLLLSNHLH